MLTNTVVLCRIAVKFGEDLHMQVDSEGRRLSQPRHTGCEKLALSFYALQLGQKLNQRL